MRYIGNKTKLLSIIDDLLKDKNLIDKNYVLCDLFSGTASVGDFFKNKFKIIANDSLYFSYCIANGKLKYKKDKYFKTLNLDPFDYFNKVNTDNYINGQN